MCPFHQDFLYTNGYDKWIQGDNIMSPLFKLVITQQALIKGLSSNSRNVLATNAAYILVLMKCNLIFGLS